MNEQPEKLNGTSLDISADNRARLKDLFPTVFTETKNDKGELVESIDFEKLKAELGTFSDVFEARRERYGMDWPGKKEALRLIQTPSAATLKPCREESVNFDTTENLFIEGDNLEVLKLLQKSYYDKVKMIYIDPPYNTGKEFIYPDNFSESLETYLEYAGLIDGEGKKFSTNTANEGRFHTKWLNMMYPRLYLARNLLRDDGVIFISIDDSELDNLKKMCDELFGEENYLNTISINMKNIAGASGGGEDKKLKKNIEYLIVYTKNYSNFNQFNNSYEYIKISELVQRYRDEGISWKYNSVILENGEKNYVGSTVDGDGNEIKIFVRKNSIIKSVNQVMRDENITEEQVYTKYSKKIFQTAMPQSSIRPRVMEKMNELGIDNDLCSIEYIPKTGRNKGSVYEQFYKGDSYRLFAWLGDVSEEIDGILYKKELQGTFWDFVGETKNLSKEGDTPLPNGKKPLSMIQRLLELVADKDAIILDFFAGSGTTGHAVLNMNLKDEGCRKFILVQLPEIIDDLNEDQTISSSFLKSINKPLTIAELTKERLRRSIKKIVNDNPIFSGDNGFKTFKLDKSNFRQWQQLDPSTSPEKVEEELFKHIRHISDKATPEDLLYEILLKAGFTPTERIETKPIAGKNVFSIAGGALLLCLEDEVTKELINAVAELEPMQFICLDLAFHGNDQLKANAVQTFAARNMQKEKHNQIIFKTV